MSKLRFYAVVVLLLVVASLAGCAPAAAPTQAPAAAPTAAPAQPAAPTAAPAAPAAPADPLADLIKAAKAEGMLTTIALPHDWCNYGEAIDSFKAKYGLQVNELNPDGGSGDEIEAIKANKDNKGPQAPDVIDVGYSFGPQIDRREAGSAVQGVHLGHHPGRYERRRRQLVR